MAEVLEKYVGRLAPSPTGALHLGNVRTFMIAWLRARSLGGRILLRMEDLDHPRDKPGAAEGAIEDLRWLGFDWDGSCVQSERRGIYRAALEKAVREVFDMTPAGITATLGLKDRKGWTYRQTAAYGHFGREGFPWEATDKVDALLAASKKYAD